ncbi:MAG: UbiA prenyltransferase family protein [Acidobacteriota bacterium]
MACIQLARPHQYIKNAFIWLPLFFGYKLTDPHAVLSTFWAFAAFSLAASGVYVLNDMLDVEEDRKHPQKRYRPLASGALSAKSGIVFLLLLLALSASITLLTLPMSFLYVLLAYLGLNLLYSLRLKHVAIVDVVCIAVFFVLRVIGGGIVAGVQASHWIVIMTFLLALFLALGKRRDDLLILSKSGQATRKCLDGYNLEFVSLSMVIMTSVVIVSYILYCVSPEVTKKHGTDNLYLTSFWVIVGLLRYMQLTFVEERSGSPTVALLNDYFLWAIIIGWITTFYWLIY